MKKHLRAIAACTMFVAAGTLLLGQTRPVAPPGAAAGPPPAAAPAVEAIHLSVTRAASNDVLRVANENYSNIATGVRVAFTVSVSNVELLEVTAMHIASFTDDKGTDLGDGTKPPRSGSSDEKPFTVVSGGQTAVVKLYSTKVPAAGAKTLKVVGTVTVRTAVGNKEIKAVSTPMRVGHVIETPEGKLTLTSAAEVHNRLEDGVSMVFNATDGMERIRNVRLANPDGTVIPATVLVKRGSPNSDPKETTVTVQLIKPIESAVLTPILYEDIRNMEIPVEMAVGVGP